MIALTYTDSRTKHRSGGRRLWASECAGPFRRRLALGTAGSEGIAAVRRATRLVRTSYAAIGMQTRHSPQLSWHERVITPTWTGMRSGRDDDWAFRWIFLVLLVVQNLMTLMTFVSLDRLFCERDLIFCACFVFFILSTHFLRRLRWLQLPIGSAELCRFPESAP